MYHAFSLNVVQRYENKNHKNLILQKVLSKKMVKWKYCPLPYIGRLEILVNLQNDIFDLVNNRIIYQNHVLSYNVEFVETQ